MPDALRSYQLAAVLLLCGIFGASTLGADEPLPERAGRYQVAEGLEVQRIMVDRGPRLGEALLGVVRADPALFEPILLTARDHGGARTVEDWVRDYELAAVANSSMYMPNLRSNGFMADGSRLNNPGVHPRLGGFLAFGARSDSVPAVTLAGSDCEGFSVDRLRADYQVIIQNYRLLDCEGEAIDWSDRKLYASVALGVDEDGFLLFIHTGTPFAMNDFARWLADSPLNLVGAVFAEGGWDSSLLLRHLGLELREIGRHSALASARPPSRPIPNVIGLRPRG